MTIPASRKHYLYWLLSTLLLIIVVAIILWLMGRVPMCTCGYIKLWHGDSISSENSQHLSDWYTGSHIIHGFIFFGLLRWLFKKRSSGWHLFVATLLESGWEILENTPMVIEHYRSATVSLHYYGDSIVNSVADILAMILGFYLAKRLPVWIIIVLILIIEIGTLYAIRDNLALNILMLITPNAQVKMWQGGSG